MISPRSTAISTVIPAEKISAIVQTLIQTPSPENSQPWHIVVDGNVLQIFHSSQRAKLATYPDDLSVFGVGMLLETLDLICSREGVAVETTLFLENRADDTPWFVASLSLAEPVSAPAPLAEALVLRHTDRRYYAGGSLNDPIFEMARHEAQLNPGANLYLINHYPAELLDLLANADQIVIAWGELRRDLMQWSRFTDKALAATRDGMPWRSFLRGPEDWIYYLRSRVWWLQTWLDWFPEWLYQLESRFFDDSCDLSPRSYADGAGIGCLTTASDSLADLVATGRLALRLWLLFNLKGYGFQPLTNLSSTIYPLQRGTLSIPAHLTHLVADGYDTLQRTFGFAAGEIPLFCFRVGRAMGPYPLKAKSLRRTDRIIHTHRK